MKEIYLDSASTNSVYSEAVKFMNKFMKEEYGNPSSLHDLGEKALASLNNARKILASGINAKPEEIIFTSGGTESNNLALFGLAGAYPFKNKIIISSIEHPSIIEPAKELERRGYKIVKIPVNKKGLIDFEFLTKNLDNQTLLVSIMHVNNIIGSVQDIKKIGELCKNKKVFFHTDAVQSFGKINIDVNKMKVDLLSASAHKIGGPKGSGFLYVKKGVKIKQIIYGGGQERDLRSGTENVPGIMGFSKAFEIYKGINKEKIKKSRDALMKEIERLGFKINGDIKERMWNNIHITFPINREIVVLALSAKRIYISTGSACDSKRDREDHVLREIGLSKKEQEGSVRITLPRELTKKEITKIIKVIKEIIQDNIIR